MRLAVICLCLCSLALCLSACIVVPVEVDAAAQQATTSPTVTPIRVQAPAATATPSPANTPELDAQPAPEIFPTPATTAAPPAGFTTRQLYRGVEPQSYFANTCEYLSRRWHPAGSAPGTIVVPIMYHGVGARANRGGGDTWTPTAYFHRTINQARELGYETVTAEQVADFLEFNARIPERSMILIVDDRRLGTVEEHFMPVLERYDWTVTLGWIIADSDQRPGLWTRLERLHSSGRLDVQSHGLRHLYIVADTPVQRIREEIYGPIPLLEERFGYRPVAFVWPGGNFTRLSVEIAREAGHRIGFTAYARGPLMFDWVPLGAHERALADPLMVLPRYWAYPGIIPQLAAAAEIGGAAREFALQNFPTEAAYFRANCGGELGE